MEITDCRGDLILLISAIPSQISTAQRPLSLTLIPVSANPVIPAKSDFWSIGLAGTTRLAFFAMLPRRFSPNGRILHRRKTTTTSLPLGSIHQSAVKSSRAIRTYEDNRRPGSRDLGVDSPRTSLSSWLRTVSPNSICFPLPYFRCLTLCGRCFTQIVCDFHVTKKDPEPLLSMECGSPTTHRTRQYPCRSRSIARIYISYHLLAVMNLLCID
ncbi:hypothetical protein BCR39DRAFT_545345 [Naematelia encephala]|uniref:Uncharacterized protein n=1 Tax=Naematelia encephala TaxID=71784 RepID=A0A1Y2AR56_9TREE|nr:hypothetical protein BCR39DRAFT_545345 [Naematelia encephala]